MEERDGRRGVGGEGEGLKGRSGKRGWEERDGRRGKKERDKGDERGRRGEV